MRRYEVRSSLADQLNSNNLYEPSETLLSYLRAEPTVTERIANGYYACSQGERVKNEVTKIVRVLAIGNVATSDKPNATVRKT